MTVFALHSFQARYFSEKRMFKEFCASLRIYKTTRVRQKDFPQNLYREKLTKYCLSKRILVELDKNRHCTLELYAILWAAPL